MENLSNIKHYMLDMDGTIYLENQLIDGALEFLKHLSSCGKDYVFLTNNSSKNPKNYIAKLAELGIKAELNQIYTSGTATIEYLKKEFPQSHIYLLGNDNLKEQFESEGIIFYDEGSNIDKTIVVLGFDTSLTYDKLNTACDLIRRGATFVATHPDTVCPLSEGRYMPDAGAMAKLITACTKIEPIVIGKPSKLMVEGVINRFGFDKNQLAMVGDRLYTDIAMAKFADITSILVLSGEATLNDVKQSPIKPDYIFNSIKDLNNQLKQ